MSRSLPDQTIALVITLPSAGSIVESPLTLIKTRMESSLAFQYTGIIQVRAATPSLCLSQTRDAARRCVPCIRRRAPRASCVDGLPLSHAMRRK